MENQFELLYSEPQKLNQRRGYGTDLYVLPQSDQPRPRPSPAVVAVSPFESHCDG